MLISKPDFKNFVTDMYYHNKDERFTYGEKIIPFETYVKNNKWFLKKMYKQEKQNGNA
jgi:hypothetical protein